jgi:hypothetical protein
MCFTVQQSIYNKRKASISPSEYSRLCSVSYFSSNIQQEYGHLMAAAQFKPFMFSVWGFALPNITYISIFMIVNDSCYS